MTPEEFESKFLRAGELRNVFHQKMTDAMSDAFVFFWVVCALAIIGAVALGWWLL